MKKRNPYLKTLLISIFLMICGGISAQRLYYSAVGKKSDIYSTTYVAGKQDNNVVVWLYKQSEKTMQINVYGSKMEILNQASLKVESIENLYSIHFLRKDNCYDLLIQYATNKHVIEEIISFNKANNTVLPLKVLSQSDVFGGLIVKNSDNGKYTGFIKGYKTLTDSILIQYSIYNNQYALISDFSFVLPQKHDAIDLEGSIVDNSGNLFFYATKEIQSPAYNQVITIYEANLEKDKLLQEDISRNGRFSNIIIQQNKMNRGLVVSGLWTTNDKGETLSKGNNVSQYLFMIELNEDFYQQKEMTLYSVNNVVDSIYTNATKSVLRSERLVASRDSGFIFYISGLTNYSEASMQANRVTKVKIPELPTSYRVQNPDPSKSIANFSQPNYYAATSENDGSTNNDRLGYIPVRTKGVNFVITVAANSSGISTLYNYEDSTAGFSLPEYEYVANTGNNMHYVYSRVLKSGKQMIFDLVLEKDGQMHLKPVVTNEDYKLNLYSGMQVSSNTIVFPFVEKRQLSFARMDLD